MFGLIKLLFGGGSRYEIKCPSCGLSGKMFTKGGVYQGLFEITGKSESGGLLIKECPECKKQLENDPLGGQVMVV